MFYDRVRIDTLEPGRCFLLDDEKYKILSFNTELKDTVFSGRLVPCLKYDTNELHFVHESIYIDVERELKNVSDDEIEQYVFNEVQAGKEKLLLLEVLRRLHIARDRKG